MDFKLPKEVKCSKEENAEGVIVYNFRHKKLGHLGRIFVRGIGEGLCKIESEVAGNIDDPRTEKRKAIFEPIAKDITDIIENTVGSPKNVHSFPSKNKPDKHLIQTKFMTCDKCEKPVAILVFAEEAYTQDVIEDYARITYSKVKEENLPTWIIGGLLDDYPKPTAKARLFK